MKTHVTETPLPGLVIVNIDHFQDERGFFIETWHKKDFTAAGLPFDFVQDSHSRSNYRVIGAMHCRPHSGRRH
jgi:dTDP-4-dehydrorhamnose 3,5-epimerase